MELPTVAPYALPGSVALPGCRRISGVSRATWVGITSESHFPGYAVHGSPKMPLLACSVRHQHLTVHTWVGWAWRVKEISKARETEIDRDREKARVRKRAF